MSLLTGICGYLIFQLLRFKVDIKLNFSFNVALKLK